MIAALAAPTGRRVRLPVRVIPRPHESTASMIRRTADALDLRPRQVYPYVPSETSRDHGRVAQYLGLQPETLVEHSLLNFPLGREQLSAGLRRGERGRCLGCGLDSFWARLALVAACPACGVILEDPRARTAPAEAWWLLEALMSSQTCPEDSNRFKRLNRLLGYHTSLGESASESTAPTGTSFWIGRRSVGVGLTPIQVADFLVDAWPASRTDIATEDCVERTVHRFIGDPEGERTSQRDEVDQLHEQLQRSGLELIEIPDYVLSRVPPMEATCHTEDLGRAIAWSLCFELRRARHGRSRPPGNTLGRFTRFRKSHEMKTMARLLGETGWGLRVLQQETEQLASMQRIDYEHRRAALRTLTRVDTRLTPGLSVRGDRRAASYAAAWIWVHLTNAPLAGGPHNPNFRPQLLAFDAKLNPEDRLMLAEYGHAHIDAIAGDVDRDMRLIALRHARRPGLADAV